MAEAEVIMFDRIISRITKNRRENRELRANDEAFKTMLAAALGDAAPADQTDAHGFVAGVEALQMQLVGARKGIQDDTSRIAELTKQRETAYDAERLALKLADDLLAEQQLIAEKLGLRADDEAAAEDRAVNEESDNPGGQTDSEIAAEREGQAMVNEVSDAAV